MARVITKSGPYRWPTIERKPRRERKGLPTKNLNKPTTNKQTDRQSNKQSSKQASKKKGKQPSGGLRLLAVARGRQQRPKSHCFRGLIPLFSKEPTKIFTGSNEVPHSPQGKNSPHMGVPFLFLLTHQNGGLSISVPFKNHKKRG